MGLFYYIIFLCLILSNCHPPPPLKTKISSQLNSSSWTTPPVVQEKKLVRPKNPSYPSKFYRKVSIAIGENIPLKDALFKLAQEIDIDIQMSTLSDKNLIFTAQDQPFIHVIEALCDLAHWRFQLNHGGLRIEEDTPYPKHYTIPFLNFVRTSDHQISVDTDVFSHNADTRKAGDNGSNSHVTVKGESNFWSEIKSNLTNLLGAESFTVHQQGGIIIVNGTAKQHAQVEEYLNSLRKASQAQVLIEAKVIEVHLKDEFKSGINWQKLMDGAWQLTLPFGDFAQRATFLPPHGGQGELLTVGYHTGSFSSLLKLLEEFGVCKILSSPRLTVMNNQVAILKAAQNQVYFRLHYDKQFYVNTNRENVTVTSDIQTVPVGWVLTVQPSIDPATGSILIALRPTISRLSHSVSDPAVDLAFHTHASTGQPLKPSLVPVMEVREIESVLRLQSGETAVLGGLMETRSSQNKSQVPYLGDLALIGPLFQAQAHWDEVIELVILLKATILDAPTIS